MAFRHAGGGSVMSREDESLVWMVAGALGSMALGVVLIPLRTLTSASNLAFVFLGFTIIVAELGGRAGKELDVVKRLVEQLRDGIPLDEILGDLKRSFGLGSMVLRDARERILAAAPVGSTPAVPDAQLAPDTLFPSDETRLRFGVRGLRLPEGGGRLRLRSDGGFVSLDLWEGDAQGFEVDERRTLTIAASILGLELSRRQAG